MTKHQTDAELQALFQEGRTWGDDRLDKAASSQRLAWIIAGIAVTVVALQAIALAGVVPLKTVVPLTVLVDRQTGHVTTLDPSKPALLGPSEALSKSMLAQYVMARESFDRASIAVDYRKVALWSGETARASYLAQMKPDNPNHLALRLPRGGAMRASIKSVSLLNNGSALVRYDLVREGGNGVESAATPYLSVMTYRFRDRPLAESDRFINPLGFEVVNYRRDPEAATSTPPAATASSGDHSQTPGEAAVGNERPMP